MLSRKYIDSISDEKVNRYLYGLVFFCLTVNKSNFTLKEFLKMNRDDINKILRNYKKVYEKQYKDSLQEDSYKLKIIIEYPIKQKKIVKRTFKWHPINKKLLVDNPSIRVIKKYGRFDKTAKELGYLKNPKSTSDDLFEVYDDSSGGFYADLSPMLMGPVIDEYGDIVNN